MRGDADRTETIRAEVQGRELPPNLLSSANEKRGRRPGCDAQAENHLSSAEDNSDPSIEGNATISSTRNVPIDPRGEDVRSMRRLAGSNNSRR